MTGRFDSLTLYHHQAGLALAAVPAPLAAAHGPAARHLPATALGPPEGTKGGQCLGGSKLDDFSTHFCTPIARARASEDRAGHQHRRVLHHHRRRGLCHRQWSVIDYSFSVDGRSVGRDTWRITDARRHIPTNRQAQGKDVRRGAQAVHAAARLGVAGLGHPAQRCVAMDGVGCGVFDGLDCKSGGSKTRGSILPLTPTTTPPFCTIQHYTYRARGPRAARQVLAPLPARQVRAGADPLPAARDPAHPAREHVPAGRCAGRRGMWR